MALHTHFHPELGTQAGGIHDGVANIELLAGKDALTSLSAFKDRSQITPGAVGNQAVGEFVLRDVRREKCGQSIACRATFDGLKIATNDLEIFRFRSLICCLHIRELSGISYQVCAVEAHGRAPLLT